MVKSLKMANARYTRKFFLGFHEQFNIAQSSLKILYVER